MENLANPPPKPGGTFQKQVCLGSTTVDSRQLMFKLVNGSSYDIIIRSDMIPFSAAVMFQWMALKCSTTSLLYSYQFFVSLKYLILV